MPEIKLKYSKILDYFKIHKRATSGIKTLKLDISSVTEAVQKNTPAVAEVRQSVGRFNDEKSNGVASIKSDIKQIRADIRVADDAAELQYLTLNEKLSELNKLEKRVSKIEAKINQNKDQTKGSHSNEKDLTLGTNSVPAAAKQESASSMGNVKQPANTECNETASKDGMSSRPQQTTVLCQSPRSKRIRRVPVTEIQNKLVSYGTHCGPVTAPLTENSVNLIDLSPSPVISGATEGCDRVLNKTSTQDTHQSNFPSQFHSSVNKDVDEYRDPKSVLRSDSGHQAHRALNHGNSSAQSLVYPDTRAKQVLSNDPSGSPLVIDTSLIETHEHYDPVNVNSCTMDGIAFESPSTVETEHDHTKGEYSYQCKVQRQNKSYSDALNMRNPVSPAEYISDKQTSIPVYISNRRDKHTTSRRDRPSHEPHPDSIQGDVDDCDDDFELHIRRKSRRFYIGGFKPSISETKLRHYVSRKGVPVTWVSIRRYESQNKAVIRLNVDADKAGKLLERGFWPRGISCRPWLTKNQFRNKVGSNRNRNNNSGPDLYNDFQADSRYRRDGLSDNDSAH